MSYGSAERQPIDIEEFERRLRGPDARKGGDPLAELARLVSGSAEAAADPLDAMFARPEPKPARITPQVAVPKPLTKNFFDESFGRSAPAVDLDRFNAELNVHNNPAPDLRGSFSGEDHALGGSHAEEGEYDAAEWEAPQIPSPAGGRGAPEQNRSRKPLLMAACAVMGVGVLGIGGLLAFSGRSARQGEIVEIKAASGPTKVQAQTVADANASPTDSAVLDKSIVTQPVKKVVDRQEQPVDLAQAARSPRVIPLAGNSSDSASIFSEPRKVKTVSIRPEDNSAAMPPPSPPAADTAAAPPARAAGAPKAAARVATTPRPVATPAPDADATATTASAPPAKLPAKPRPKIAQSTPAPMKVASAAEANQDTANGAEAPASGGSFAVQLGAPGTEAEARALATRLGQKFGSELSGHHISFHKAADKNVYRVRAAGMSREEAVIACEKIKSSGGACFVAKN